MSKSKEFKRKEIPLINLEGFEFPIKVKDIKKKEKQNPNIAINVFGIKKDINSKVNIEKIKNAIKKKEELIKKNNIEFKVLNKLPGFEDAKQKRKYNDIKKRLEKYIAELEDLKLELEKSNNKNKLIDRNEIKTYEDYKNNCFPIQLSPAMQKAFKNQQPCEREIIDLLYFENAQIKTDGTYNGKYHYIYISDISGFLNTTHNKAFICRNCMNFFSSPQVVKNHEEACIRNNPTKIEMPEENNKTIKFEKSFMKNKRPFIIYADFEAYNIASRPSDIAMRPSGVSEDDGQSPAQAVGQSPAQADGQSPAQADDLQDGIIAKQTPNSYCLYIKSLYPKIYPSREVLYRKPDAANHFVNTVVSIYEEILENFNKFENLPLTGKLEEIFDKADKCYMCKNTFTYETGKVREHNHLTGEYRGAACRSCNVKEGKANKNIPVVFHNGSGYDFHFIVEPLTRISNEEGNQNKIKLIPRTTENYISIMYGNYYSNLIFIDSIRFLRESLDTITSTLEAEKFIITNEKYHDKTPEQIKLLTKKGIYPYEWVDSEEKFNHIGLPPIEKFYSTLYQRGIEEKEYNHAQLVYNTFNCQNFGDYHDLYLRTDVYLLADVFENFRNFFLESFEIDPSYCYSLPGLTWQCGLKHTKIELELLTDINMLLMFEKGIRGGFSGVLGDRYFKANNKYLPDYDPTKPSTFLAYQDYNNLYGGGMSLELPTGDFKWELNFSGEEEEEVSFNPSINTTPFNWENPPEGRGCILEVDLEYTPEAKAKTYRYPLAPENYIPTDEDLSPLQQEYLLKEGKKKGNNSKLTMNLYDKKKYVLHYKTLLFYKNQGMKVSKIHRIISFKQAAWLKSYIDFNTEQRKNSKSKFEKDLFKLLNNAFYGKTVENIRERINFKITSDPVKAKKQFTKPHFEDIIIFNEEFVGIKMLKRSIKFSKPIYIGMVVLEYAKLAMYEYVYNVVLKQWPDAMIHYMDTDSVMFSAKTEDIFEDYRNIIDILDTSEFPKDHFLYSEKNNKAIGKMKDELKGNVISEGVFLRAKAYSMTQTGTGDLKEIKKLKGIKKNYVEDNVKFQHFKKCLSSDGKNLPTALQHRLGSNKHNINLYANEKKIMSPYDDKRYLINTVETIPHADFPTSILLEILKTIEEELIISNDEIRNIVEATISHKEALLSPEVK